MTFSHFKFQTDSDGVALAIWDMNDRSMNIITPEVMDEIDRLIDIVVQDGAVKGCVVASGKSQFSGGADLAMIEGLGVGLAQAAEETGTDAAMEVFVRQSSRLSRLYRKLETCGKPFAAAIHGICLGGAFEWALACHYRVLSDHPSTRVGLPEIKVGLFPGAGGTQRVARLAPTQDGLTLLMRGEQIKAGAARSLNLVHAVVPLDAMIDHAKAWIVQGGKAVAPWDEPSFRLPSGPVYSPSGMQLWPAINAIYRRETHDNYPAARALLQSVFEGLLLPMDQALQVESRYFAHILRSKEAAAMIRTLFLSLQDLNKGARRPSGIADSTLKKVGILGAGFMGAGIAYVTALAGIDVVLIDRDQESADKGKAYSHRLMSAQINKGRAKTADREALLARIRAGDDYALLKDCDLVIEAVFEDPAVKAEAIAKASAVIRDDCIFASNTSTLPIGGLAEHAARPDRFVGLHFFSPVEKMMLVEIIRGAKTGDKALAVALDYVRAIRKTPILVNDSRGFFTSRVVGTYIREGHLMLMESVPPAMIENVARMAGMPVGPLALNDEVAIDLAWKILKAAKEADPADVDPVQETLLSSMVETQGRLGRKNGKGFYDYDERGGKKLWPGLRDLQPAHREPETLDIEEMKQRFLVMQALETARIFEEGVLTDPREGDVGAILGFGYAPFTGGPLSYIDGMGAKAFTDLCAALEKAHGARFRPCTLLLDMAQAGEGFYGNALRQTA